MVDQAISNSKRNPLDYEPLFTLNGETEDAINILLGVSCVMRLLSMVDKSSLDTCNIEHAFAALGGITDACIERLANNDR